MEVPLGKSIQYAVQTFVCDRQGRRMPGRLVRCPNAEEARRYAERAVEDHRAVGAAAFSQRALGEFETEPEPITFAAFGDVPAEVRDQLPF